MLMKMKAAVLELVGPIENDPLVVKDVPIPSIRRRQVLVRVAACGVCRSNLHMIEGDWVQYGFPAKTPIIPGHEIVGTVAKIGEDVTLLHEGDRVGIQPLWNSCGVCEFCFTGREYLCESSVWIGEMVDGGYSEYVVANADYVTPVPKGLKDSEVAPLFCPGLTAYGAVKKAELGPGKRVAVFGIGGVGHMVIQFANLYGAEIIAVTRNRLHHVLAKELGASSIVDTSQGDEPGWLKEIGNVDSSIIFAPSSAVLQLAVKATKRGGTIVYGVWGNLGVVPFHDEKKVVGAEVGSRQAMREVLKIAESGRIKCICEEFSLDRANEALQALKAGNIKARGVLLP
jgi:propanol-preferring alcohol dehydrogenase